MYRKYVSKPTPLTHGVYKVNITVKNLRTAQMTLKPHGK